MIRIEAVWLATVPLDMRCSTDSALARVVKVFGEARAHHAYLFANARANRMKVLVHDGIGIWLCARRLHQGRFVWPTSMTAQAALTTACGVGGRPAMTTPGKRGRHPHRLGLLACA